MPNRTVCVLPQYPGEDRADGGIRRVVEAQSKYLPQFGWDVVPATVIETADVVATHAAHYIDIPADTPLVSHCHGLYWSTYEWERWALKMNRDVIRSMRRADAVTAPSEWVAQAIRRGSQIDPTVLYHGVDADEWSPARMAKPLNYVLWNKTRIDSICDPTPVHRLATLAPTTQFVSTLAMPGLETPVNMAVVGVQSYEASRPLVGSAAVYLATTRETFGIGTIEAMSCGVPVLGWDWGGQHEIVDHKVNGWLAPEGDYDSLVEGLEWCLAHRQDAGRAGRESVLAHWTWERAIERYARLYERVLASVAGAREPLVSVVMPVHNMERYIEDAITSVQGQAFDNWELVVVDDASTDNSMAIVDRLATSDGRIHVVTNPSNLYLAETLNAGIRTARGRYVLPLDSDNMLGDGALGLLVDALERDRDIAIAYGAMSVIETDGIDSRGEWTSEWPKQFDYRRQMIHQNQITSTALYRRTAWERVGGYRRRCRTAEDADFWCRTTSFGANARKVTDAVVLRYRNRSDSMSHVQADWPWHEWYTWNHDTALTPWIAPVGAEERNDPIIPPYEMPLVSVVIPVGPKHERLVLDALDSLNAQTFRWWEAIVVNDTGRPLTDIPAWARIVGDGGPSSGAGASRNAGMAIARGKLFIFLDADDYFQPRALELMVEAWARAGGFVYTDWFRQETGEVYTAPDWDGCESVLHQLPWSVTCLYPRSVWEDTGGFDVSLPAWEDWDFALRVVRAGYCGTRVAVPLLHYRIDSGSRREAGFADRDNLKQSIFDRWSQYITGDVKMPCGCAGGGGLPSLPALDLSNGSFSGRVMLPPQIEGVAAADMILIEFTDDVPAPLTFSGKVTGTRYRFGSDDDNRVRYVYRQDAEALLTRGEFRVYNEVDATATLAAAGPPR